MNQKIDLLVSFDTTGSMFPVLAQVRQDVEKFVKTMFSEFDDLKIGVIAHGDYCDKDNPYTIRVMDLTSDEQRLCKFIRETDKTWGGDADECYELVLHTAHKDISWRKDADRIMLMIGDASPHGVTYRDNKLRLDWRDEAETLAIDGVKVFAVHALSYYRQSSKEFYRRTAEITGGVYLTLDQFNEVVDLIKATCYQQGGEERLNEFVTIIRDNGRMTRSMDNNIRRLRGEKVEDTYDTYESARRGGGMSYSSKKRTVATSDVTLKEMGKLVPVAPGRFQTMVVDADTAIKAFVESNGIEFKKGRGFYELSKAETVQQYKEVIIQDRETGEMFNGTQVREELGLQPQSEKGGIKERLHKSAADKYRVFVQSTSVNRKLIKGTTFLYEISDIEDTGTVVEVEETAMPVKKTTEKKTVAKATTKKTSEKKTTTKSKTTKPATKKATTKKVEEAVVETPVVETKPAAKKRNTKKAEKATLETIKKTVDVVSDKPAKTAKTVEKVVTTDEKAKTKDEIAKEKEAMQKELAKAQEKLSVQLEKITDGFGRCSKSVNVKNKTFLKNNLSKLSKDIDKILAIIGE